MLKIKNYILEQKLKNPKEPFCAYLYDCSALREHVIQVKRSLPDGCQLFYAVKANSQAKIIETLAPLVDGFEVASYGEIEKVRAIDSNIPLIFGGPAKTDAELRGAIEKKVRYIHVESLHELYRLHEIASSLEAKVSILLRVNLHSPLPSGQLQMAGKATQFGIDESQIPNVLEKLKEMSFLQLHGFHFHSMSNNLDEEAHVRFVSLCIEKAQQWAMDYDVPLSVVNVGGGIGVNYNEVDQQFHWSDFTNQLKQVLKEKEPCPGIYFECGRFLTAACGYYAVEVLDIKQNHGKWFAVVRGGSHHFRLPAAWKHSHPFAVLAIDHWSYPFPRMEISQVPATVAGELCTPNDVLAREVKVERLRLGDIFIFQYAGAYGWDISHHDFLSHPYPEMIFLE
ncbi:type III PLP-dependent enzyme [Thermoflavimicrobium dichotomicum]|uniref:Diaminopimelate decarboxylase n=1 Tax=Thermoflavimicrobium dichotomicum TaxID=46223 RepID=A0A1I3MEH4_9BACL|nr:type III PLP-dependent enzyme [Thermoflavimicrobium dichotomicum]SFI95383.1 diaminopimelate decarboxylase [Thermoflavimicrobium dichotomicum]